MLKVIDLYIIDQIFSESPVKLSATAQALYLNCLIWKFKDQPATELGAFAFEVGYSTCNHDKFKKQFDELQAAGLITYEQAFIRFENVWSKHIDTRRFNEPDQVLNQESIIEQARSSRQGLDVVGMRLRITAQEVTRLFDLFILEQKAVGKSYSAPEKCIRHFINWSQVGNKKELLNNQNRNNGTKLLGQ